MSNLRAKRSQQTRNDIFEAAMVLFHQNGFEQTTMQQIADAANVSRRTAYRFFPSKEDLVFEPPRQWMELHQKFLANRRSNQPIQDTLADSYLALASHIQADRRRVVSAYNVMMANPSLQGRHGATDQEWTLSAAALLASEHTPKGKQAQLDLELQCYVAAGALTSAMNAVIGLWASRPDSDIELMIQKALPTLDSVWP